MSHYRNLHNANGRLLARYVVQSGGVGVAITTASWEKLIVPTWKILGFPDEDAYKSEWGKYSYCDLCQHWHKSDDKTYTPASVSHLRITPGIVKKYLETEHK